MIRRGSVPMVYRPLKSESTKISVYIPYKGYSWRESLHKATGGRVAYDHTNKTWQLSRKHMRSVVEFLAREFNSVEVWLDHSRSELCTVSCRTAEVTDWTECECICAGKFHGDGVGGDRVVDQMVISDTVVRAHRTMHAA